MGPGIPNPLGGIDTQGEDYVCVNLPPGNFTYRSNITAYDGKVFQYSPYWTLTNEASNVLEATLLPLAGPWCLSMFKFFYHLLYHPEATNGGDLLNCEATNLAVLEQLTPTSNFSIYSLVQICGQCDIGNKALGGGSAEAARRKCAEVGM